MFGHFHHFGPRGGGRGRGGPWDPSRWERFAEEIARSAIGGEPMGRGGGRRRVFDGGELRLVLLKLIEEQPRHGYDLIREIEERTGGLYAPSAGVVYPTLTMLTDMGLIAEQESEGARKVYAVTTAGQAHLTEREEDVVALMARLSDLGAARDRGRRGSIRRAMGNLRSVLGSALDEANADRQHEIAAILDEAAQRIERLGR